MARLQSDLVELIEAALDHRLDQVTATWDPRASLGVVIAAGGYPENYPKGDVISGLPTQEHPDSKVFHAGTKLQGNDVVTNGGRVLCVVGLGENVSQAQATAYALTRQISWKNAYYRDDIGYRAVAREAEKQ